MKYRISTAYYNKPAIVSAEHLVEHFDDSHSLSSGQLEEVVSRQNYLMSILGELVAEHIKRNNLSPEDIKAFFRVSDSVEMVVVDDQV